MIDAIKHADYEKLTDDLCMIGFNTILRFNVTLSKKLKDGTRYNYHHEYKYNTNKYINQNSLITLRRSFDFYLSIENLKSIDGSMKECIMITVNDILFIRSKLKESLKWFESDLYAYNSKTNKLIMLGKTDPIIIPDLRMGKYLMIEPIILNRNDKDIMGVRLYLSSNENFVDITIDNYMGFTYLIDTINMYQSAQLLVNYLQRPELGENIHQFDNSAEYEGNEAFIKTTTTRKVGDNKKQKSFFNKMDEL